MTLRRPRSLALTLALAVATVLPLATLLALAPIAWAGVGDYNCTNASKVYFGNSRLFQRPATIDCDKVYSRISEYKEIVRRGLTEKDAHYHLLMKKATKRFTEAIKKMAKADNHDLVAQKGTVKKAKKKAKDIPDRTANVIKKLD